jgi:hypothetical protein
MYVNGRQVPSEGLSLSMAGAKTCTLAHQTLYSGLRNRHRNTGIHITPAQFMKGSYMLVFDLMPDSSAWDGHTRLPENGIIRIELKSDGFLSEAATVLLYQEVEASIQIDRFRNVTTDF